MTIDRIDSNARMSQGVVHAGLVYTAGQVALDHRHASVGDQTRQVLAQIDAVLAKAGTDKSQILTATIWLTDMAHFNVMNTVWDAWVAQGTTPARATVGAALALPGIDVEIAVIAAIPAI